MSMNYDYGFIMQNEVGGSLLYNVGLSYGQCI